ncbi:hypothetical protein LTR96_005485 [Exophiala xenobiotica]|nr:hypothetical protein LTR96_005485 [Exophiala xenobiotica]
MADARVNTSADTKALVKQHREFKLQTAEQHVFVEKLLELLAVKDQAYADLQADLNDQTESRRRWQNRAVDVESRITSVQHVLVLIDGNQHFFKPDFIRAGTAGAQEAIRSFISEAKEVARAQHKNDLPENISPVVHIFSDIGRLAQDLSAASLLPDPDQLWTFIQDICKIEPGITVSNCGSGHEAVDAKLKYFYELYIENCHCRHVFLALGQHSNYYNILQLYGDEDYTKGKTSLVRPSQGFAPGHDVPFHSVDFSAFDSIPSPSAFSSRTSNPINGQTPTLQWNGHDQGEAPVTLQSSKSNGNQSSTSRDTSDGMNGVLKEPEDESSMGVVKLDSAHSSSQSNKAAEQSWETSVSENTYTPLPIQGAWGEETTNETSSHEEPNTWAAETRPPRRRGNDNANNRGSKTWRQEPPRPNTFSRPQGRAPRQFQGSWDDMVEQEASQRVHQTSPQATPELRAASRASSFIAPAFTKKIPSMTEPHPERRPVCSPIALNKLDQRIDLKLPRPSLEDQERFDIRSRNRRLCNDHHMRSNCNKADCPYDHEPIVDGVYLALRLKARKIPCSIGPNCRRHDCYGSHHCPNVSHSSACGKPNCTFEARGMHGVTDLEIVRTIEPAAADEA